MEQFKDRLSVGRVVITGAGQKDILCAFKNLTSKKPIFCGFANNYLVVYCRNPGSDGESSYWNKPITFEILSKIIESVV